jgi:hypothetical protein
VEGVRTLEKRVQSVRFAGHRAFARQAPNDVFRHHRPQQSGVAIAETANEILRNSLFSCSVIPVSFKGTAEKVCNIPRSSRWMRLNLFDQNIVFSFSDVFGMA